MQTNGEPTPAHLTPEARHLIQNHVQLLLSACRLLRQDGAKEMVVSTIEQQAQVIEELFAMLFPDDFQARV